MNKPILTLFSKWIWNEQDAVTSIEYALLASLIAVVIVVSVGLVGNNTSTLFGMISNCVSFATSGAGSCP
jgi:Flp pilus assembly pilin Flp